MMFDVGCLFGKEDIEIIPNFGACELVLPGITWHVEESSVFNGKVFISNDVFLVNGSSLCLVNSLQSSMHVNSNAMGVVGSHCASNAISFSCSCFRKTVP